MSAVYYFKPGYELEGWAEEYEVLFRPDGSKLAALTEPEDRNFYRDLASVVTELNRLTSTIEAKDAEIARLRMALEEEGE